MRNQPKLIVRFFIFCCFQIGFGQFATAQTSGTTSIFNILTENENAKITLELDLTTLNQNRKTNTYFPATLSTSDGKTRQVEIRSRGKYRRKTCELPPLKLKFSKKDLRAAGLTDSLNEMKLVVPCFDSRDGEALLLKEYLAYRIFEGVSPLSFRARLIKITIRDTHVEKSKISSWAILLEDKEELCARTKTMEIEKYGIEPDSLHAQQAAMMVMFQYMIGNTDWEIATMRNILLLKTAETGKIYTVPFDFDFSGLVSAPYSSPNSETGLKTVRDRFLMSSGVKTEALRRAAKILVANKKQIYDICRNKNLNRDYQEEVIDFLDEFIKVAQSNDELPVVFKSPLRID